MSSEKDYYRVLGVPRTASQEEIRTTFRRLALEYHPDRNKSPDAQAKFKEVNAAYQVLSDPEKRAQYDRYGRVGPSSGSGYGRGFHGADSFGGFGDIFDAFFGGSGGGARSSARPGRDIRSRVTLSFEEAVFGVEKEIELGRIESCGRCEGTACEPGSSREQCTPCGGSGQVRRTSQSIFGQFTQVATCERCKGEGTLASNPCTQCDGIGLERRQRRISVDIPAGVDNGMQVRLTREGDAGSRGGRPGNLYVDLVVKPHKTFSRKDNDILMELQINFAQAALGDEVSVPTLNGLQTLRIPGGTQSGTVLRIKGKGVPYSSGGKRGDQLVIVGVVTPNSLDGRQKELFEELSRTLSDASDKPKGWVGKVKDALGKE